MVTTAQHIRKAQFINALAGSNNDEGIEGSESLDVEDLMEEVEIKILSSGGSSEDEDMSKSVTQQLYSHSCTMKSMKTQSHGSC